jgi:hypothetical protein
VLPQFFEALLKPEVTFEPYSQQIALKEIPLPQYQILSFKKKLGHQSIHDTIIYTKLVEWKTEEYTSKIATSIKEAKELVDPGFEFVCDFGLEGKLFTKEMVFGQETFSVLLAEQAVLWGELKATCTNLIFESNE